MQQLTTRAAAYNQFLVRPNPDRALTVPTVRPPLYSGYGLAGLTRTFPTARLGRLSASASQITGHAGGIAAGAVPAILAAAHITGALVPLVGPAILGITMGIQALLNSGCGQSCVVTSNWANQAEALLKDNINTYFAQPVRTRTMQTAALANFDGIWSYLAQQCGQVNAPAGQRCISDRQSGACVWHADSDSPYPGGPALGACWNWFNGYRDPIANDPGVVSDPPPSSQSGGGNGTTPGGDTGDLLGSIFGGGDDGSGGDLGTKSMMPLLIGGLLIVALMSGGNN